MAALMHSQFADFFQAVHHNGLFDWQRRLAREVLNGGWPEVICVPTSCGKTCILDLAVFELAMQAELEPSKRLATRRICFVIDRRLVVDEVTEHAHRIQGALREAANAKRDEPVLRAVAERLAKLSVNKFDLLRVVRMRGGVYRDDGWAADPLTPTILISTVDQIGSRLLFRGYGVSARSRPVHAGLLAFDTRVILDEAHLSTVFAKTLGRIRQYQNWADDSPLSHEHGVNMVRMSATIGVSEGAFQLSDDERKDGRLKPRLDSSKIAELVEVKTESIANEMRRKQPHMARQQEKNNRAELVLNLVNQSKRLAWPKDGLSTSPQVIGIVVNRVVTARNVFEILREAKGTEPARDAILLTGRIRPYDRDSLLHDWLPRIRSGRKIQADRPLFVVATQTVEVGANLDFDALVTEAAPIDALRQRFGRLDRLGRRHERNEESPAVIVIRSDHKSSSYDDPIYGSAVAATWKWLNEKDVRDRSRRVDFGVNHLDPKLRKAGDLTPMLAAQPDDPLLFPAHLDAWVQTDPVPEPDPAVEPFLHGLVNSAADVQIVWRADIKDNNQTSWKGIVGLVPPRSREALSVPIYEVRRWLRHEAVADIADVDGSIVNDEHQKRYDERLALRWRGPRDHQTRVIYPEEVRPGDTIVVPANYGGADRFGWNPISKVPVADVAEECLTQLIGSYPEDAFRRPKLRLRLHHLLLPKPGGLPSIRLQTMLAAAVAAAHAEQGDPWPLVRQFLRAMAEYRREPALTAAIETLIKATFPPHIRNYPLRDGLVLVAGLSLALPEEQAAPPEEIEDEEPEEDESSLSAGLSPILLSKHVDAVEQMSGMFAKLCGLSNELTDILRLAAHWHDQGKRDPRFQAWLHGSEGRALTALAAGRPLAKSGRDPKDWASSGVFAYPRGSRHEFVSVVLFEQAEGSRALIDPSIKLAKLLIGTHHGHGRPFPPLVNDPNPVTVTLTYNERPISASSDHALHYLDSGWADLFWGMVRRYGWWGLAYLEALLITADRMVSSREQQTHGVV